MSIILTAKANNLDVFKYFVFLFEHMHGTHFMENRAYMESLLPWGELAQATCRSRFAPSRTDIELVGGGKAA